MSEDKDYDCYDWEGFEKYCEEHGISMHPDDCTEWWSCWKAGYISCLGRDFE